MKNVLVTGGTGRIGEAIVRMFANADHKVAFTFKTNESLARKLVSETGSRSHQVDFLSRWEPVSENFDILVNAAGVNLSGTNLVDCDDAEILNTFLVNTLPSVALARAYAPYMADAGFGRVININSVYGLTCPAKRLSYGMSKFALRGATISMANEFAATGVTVNDVCPGPVDSEMLRGMGQQAIDAGRAASMDEYLADCASSVPIGRLIRPEEVAATVAFLASPLAGACTGLAICVDGGMTPR